MVATVGPDTGVTFVPEVICWPPQVMPLKLGTDAPACPVKIGVTEPFECTTPAFA